MKTKIQKQTETTESLITALQGLLDWGRDHISPVHNPEAHELLIAAHNAIAKAKKEAA